MLPSFAMASSNKLSTTLFFEEVELSGKIFLGKNSLKTIKDRVEKTTTNKA
jgi:hypothetical protein